VCVCVCSPNGMVLSLSLHVTVGNSCRISRTVLNLPYNVLVATCSKNFPMPRRANCSHVKRN
jgi:hypothetical protein